MISIYPINSCRNPSTEVANVGIAVEAHNREADQAQDHVKDDDGSAEMVLVTSPAGNEHDDSSESIRRCNEALRSTDGEAHILS